ncbi:hypothetical protein [Anabaena cylindrica]|uniref:Uncharacterized protein n=1 Tax=Anabaena cylindrica (strain ATCC 27899 / PCC 7122) TaxID=272123 RepID=K9ZPA8_ANACC|nr:hypothetical protein [Anabaena cylindrica]AFZ60160.1 hypothetical protein Anacy_4816 [Anabaena cylindrica PCC 7122]
MKPITIDKLPEDLETLLAEIAATGDRLEFDWKGKRFQILPAPKKINLKNLFLIQKYTLAILTIW